MKKYFAIIISGFLFIHQAKAQNNPATQLANKIAQKMTDSLGLTSQQKQSIVDINLNLHQQKTLARQQHPGVSATTYIQKIENSRDSLYQQVLPADKFLLYQQKRNKLVNNN